jgi:hypothetical protein
MNQTGIIVTTSFEVLPLHQATKYIVLVINNDIVFILDCKRLVDLFQE